MSSTPTIVQIRRIHAWGSPLVSVRRAVARARDPRGGGAR